MKTLTDARLEAFLDLLVRGPGLSAAERVFNPWSQHDPLHDISREAPAIRLDNLRRYLAGRMDSARAALIAEAPSYAGAKFCGIAMCCERMMLAEPSGAASAFFDGEKRRTSRAAPGLHNDAGMLERTASIVWKTMAEGGYAPHEWVTWNAFAWHPFEAGNGLTNRTPTPRELQAGLPVLRAFLDCFPHAKRVAVGQVCQRTLASLGIEAHGVRHPSYGGAPEFRQGVAALGGKL